MTIIKQIKEQAYNLMQDLLEVRRYLHKNPELSFEEYNTSSYIKQVLDKHGISYTDGWVKTGIVATVTGGNPGKERVLRADIDALPIMETNEVDYKSTNEGVMHACGHDVHTTCALGAAIILNKMKGDLSGSVKIIFQPGEEQLPGGASLMLKEKALGDQLPSYIVGQHVHPPLQAGKVGICAGQYMASADEIFLTVEGKGGHGALPQNTIDPVVVTSYIITAIQSIVSRRANPTIPSVVTFGKIESDGGATNVIPDRVRLQGTFRTFDEDWRREAHLLLRKVIEQTAAAHGAKADLEIKVGYPSLFNHLDLTKSVRSYMQQYLGAENVVDLPIRMSAEDFSYYSQVMPGVFYRLGTGNKDKGITSPVHTSTFDIDEDALPIGAGLMAYLAWYELL